jgi:hypothetical protein
MTGVKFGATEELNLQKKCGNSNCILIREKKVFRVIYSEMLYPVKQDKNEGFLDRWICIVSNREKINEDLNCSQWVCELPRVNFLSHRASWVT